MAHSSSTSHDGQDETGGSESTILARWKLPGLLLLGLVVLAIAALAVVNPPQSYENSELIAGLNFVFITLIAIAIAASVARSYLVSSSPNLLWIGSAWLIFGIATPLSAALLPLGANVAVTIHNGEALAASICQVVSGVLALGTVSGGSRRPGNPHALVTAYAASLAFVGLYALAAAGGLVPAFIMPSGDFTLLRQVVLGGATVLCMVAAITYGAVYVRSRSDFVYWYALSLVAVSVGLLAVLSQSSVGSVLSWVGRGAQQLGGVYLLLAAVVALREARQKSVGVDSVLAGLFEDPLASYRLVFEAALNALVSTDQEGRVQLWNPAAERIFGYEAVEAVGTPLSRLVVPAGRDDFVGRELAALRGLAKDVFVGEARLVELARRDGEVFPARFSFAAKRTNSRWFTSIQVSDLSQERQAEAERERLLTDVEAARRRFEAVLEYSPSGIAVFRGDDFRFQFVNPAYQRFGPGKRMDGRTFAEVWPEVGDGLLPVLRRVLETGEAYHAADAHLPVQRSPNGPLEEAYWTFSLLRLPPDESEQPGILNTAVETTVSVLARRREEELTRRAESSLAQLQAVIDSMSEGLVIADLEGHVLTMNPAILSLCGYTRPEEAQRALPDFADTFEVRHLDGSLATVEEWPVPRVLRGEQLSGAEFQVINIRVGEPRIWSYSGRLVRDSEGCPMLGVVTVRDVTDQKRAEADLTLERDRLHTTIESIADVVMVCDRAGRITMSNGATRALFGEDLVERERTLADYANALKLRYRHNGLPVPAEDLAVTRALSGEVTRDREETATHPTASHRLDLLISAAPLRDAEGEIVGAVEVARDVSALTALEHEKDEFIAVAAHELKTPVAIVKSFAQALLRRSPDIDPVQRRMLDSIDRGCNRIDRIVRDLLDISRLQGGQLELSRDRLDLATLVEEVVARMALVTTKHQLRVASAEPVVVWGDRDRLEQVLAVVVDNAIRYSPRGGDVDVAMAVGTREVVVEVRDQGVGIPTEKQGRLFERFYRAHTGTAYDYGGMGVGLYISKEIISRHGGRIWVESQEGKGTTVAFSLPLAGGSR